MTTELGRLVNDLVNAAHKCGAGEDSTSGEQYKVLWSAQVAAEKALLEYVEKRERELAEAIIARDEARSRYTQVVLNRDAIHEGVENLAASWEQRMPGSTGVYGPALCAQELRALLK